MLTVYRDEVEVNAARPGENLRLRLQGIEEEDISAGGRCVWVFGGVHAAVEHVQGGGWAKHTCSAWLRYQQPLPAPYLPATAGFVLCNRFSLVPAVTQFEAQLVILELLDHKPLLTGGYKAVLHIHSGERGVGGWGGLAGACSTSRRQMSAATCL